jgi:hypothetical protein
MTTTTKERPILFNTQMIKAILAGRKTQTRRAVKLDGFSTITLEAIFNLPQQTQYLYLGKDDQTISVSEDCIDSICPYGRIGDILWVRETFAEIGCIGWPIDKFEYAYRADFAHNNGKWEGYADMCFEKWKPSIFMPRSASRILLRISKIRVERLQEISEEDAMAEGVDCLFSIDAINKYQQLWNKINGERAWIANPWVWVVEFESLSTQANFCNSINPNTNAAH